MPRRELLASAQREELLACPTTEADLLRHYTFDTHDLAVIRRRRGDHNRLGFAAQLPDRDFGFTALAASAFGTRARTIWDCKATLARRGRSSGPRGR